MHVTNTFILCVIWNNPEGCSNNTKQCLDYPHAKISSNIKKYIFDTYVYSSEVYSCLVLLVIQELKIKIQKFFIS